MMPAAPEPPPPPAAPPAATAVPTGPQRIAGVIAPLAVLVLVAAVAVGAGIASFRGRPGGPRALAIASLVCVPGFLIGRVLVATPPAAPGRAFVAAVAAIALRTLLPLAALGWLTAGRHGPADPAAGPAPVDAAATLVAFYLALLATDVVLHVAASPRRGRGH